MSEIKVVPCPYGGRYFSVTLEGKDYMDGGMHYCASEAEALEKAAELRKEYKLSPEAAASLEEQLTPRPVETRPPASTGFSETNMPTITISHGAPSGAAPPIWREHPSNENPEPIEQAAPPRPLDEVVIEHLGYGIYEGEILRGFRPTIPEAKRFAAEIEQAQRSSEVKPNEAQSQKSAAIEQARPQPPTVYDHKFLAYECQSHGCHFLFLEHGGNCAHCPTPKPGLVSDILESLGDYHAILDAEKKFDRADSVHWCIQKVKEIKEKNRVL